MTTSLRWYDRAAAHYDLITWNDWFYRETRRGAVDALRLEEGDPVLDLFCGTGVNFSLLHEGVGTRGVIVGIDGSAKMLARARPRARGADGVELVEADFTTDEGISIVRKAAERSGATRYLFTLGLTCLPNWREFFNAVFDAAPSGSRFSIMDCHADRLTAGARLMNWVASADCRRPVWEELERRGRDVHRDMHPMALFSGVSVVVASGAK